MKWDLILGELFVNLYELDQVFSIDEVNEVVFSFDRNKAPGLDDFTSLFFQKCWKCMKDDLLILL